MSGEEVGILGRTRDEGLKQEAHENRGFRPRAFSGGKDGGEREHRVFRDSLR